MQKTNCFLPCCPVSKCAPHSNPTSMLYLDNHPSVFVKDSFQDPSQIPRSVDAQVLCIKWPSVSADEESVGTSGRLYYLSWLNCLSCVQIKYRFICSSRTTSFHPLKNAANGGVHGGLSANAF